LSSLSFAQEPVLMVCWGVLMLLSLLVQLADAGVAGQKTMKEKWH
jgi:hypothetical protein